MKIFIKISSLLLLCACLALSGIALDYFAQGLQEIAQKFVIEAKFVSDAKDKNGKYMTGAHDTYVFKEGGPESTTIHIVIGDVLGQGAQAIVNAANVALVGGGGMDALVEKQAKKAMGDIDVVGLHWKSGKPKEWDTNDIDQSTGMAFLNTSLRLPGGVRVIQTAGPSCGKTMTDKQKRQLKDAYYNSLAAADKNDIKSVAFPLISSGIFGCDSEEAYQASVQGVFGYFVDHYKTNIQDVYIVMYHQKVGSDKNDPDTRFRFWVENVIQSWAANAGGIVVRQKE